MCAFLSKAGEAANASLIFVRDETVTRIIAAANQQHQLFLADQTMRKEEKRQALQATNEAVAIVRAAEEVPYTSRVEANMDGAEVEEERPHNILPLGWRAVASRSRPGKFSYLNIATREIIQTHPLDVPARIKEREKGSNAMPRTSVKRLHSLFSIDEISEAIDKAICASCVIATYYNP